MWGCPLCIRSGFLMRGGARLLCRTAPSTSASLSAPSRPRRVATSTRSWTGASRAPFSACPSPHRGRHRCRAFNLYDLNGDGFISRSEMLSIVESIYKMVGTMVTLPADEDTPAKRVDKIFAQMDKVVWFACWRCRPPWLANPTTAFFFFFFW